jgi:homocysteine S-methyltransferase
MNKTKFIKWIQTQNHILIDSSMSTGLEERGLKLNNELWTAQALANHPNTISDVHRKYFDAGSSLTTLNTYQASIPGLLKAGFTHDQAVSLIKTAVQAAQDGKTKTTNPNPKWLAAGIGPYGAYLANGAEYTGNYNLSSKAYQKFHQERLDILAQAGVDVLLLETIPNWLELKTLVHATKQYDLPLIASLSLRNDHQLADGTNLDIIQDFLEKQPQVVAYGLNCSHPALVTPTLKNFKHHIPHHKPFIAFPNSGASYNPDIKQWNNDAISITEFDELIATWFTLGLKYIGGCCCMSEQQVHHIAQKFFNYTN